MVRFRCERDELAEALGTVSRAVATTRSGQSGPVGMKLELTGDRLELVGSDRELTISATIEVGGEVDGKIVVPTKTADVVRSLPPGKIDLVADESSLVITADRAEFSLNLLPTEQWQQPSEPTGEPVELDATALAEGLAQVIKAASKDDSRSPALTGVLFAPEEAGLRLVTTDSYRLAMRDLTGTSVEGLDRPVLIPSRALAELQRLLVGHEVVALQLTDVDASFSVGGTRLTTRLIEQQFPAYQNLIPKNQRNRLSVGRAALSDAVKRVRVMSGDGDMTTLALQIGSDSLELIVKTRDLGEAHETVEAKYEGDDMKIAFNAKYFAEGLEVSPGDEIGLELESAAKAAVLRPTDSSDFLYLLMPVHSS